MKNTLKKFAIASLLCGVAGGASAASFDFYLGGNGGAGESYSYETNGVTLTVTAGSFKDGFDGNYSTQYDDDGNAVQGYITSGNNYDQNALVGQFSSGLGVYNNTYNCGNHICTTDDYHTVDGSNWDDFLILSFSEDVQLTSADFEYFGSHDDFRLFYDLSGDGVLGDDDFISYREDDDPFYGFPVVSKNLIGFVATDNNDKWKLKSVHGHVSAVPLPAGGLLLLAGLGGLGLLRKRSS